MDVTMLITSYLFSYKQKCSCKEYQMDRCTCLCQDCLAGKYCIAKYSEWHMENQDHYHDYDDYYSEEMCNGYEW